MAFRPVRGRRALLRPGTALAVALLAAACSDLTTPAADAPAAEGKISAPVIVDAPTAGATLSGIATFRAHVQGYTPSQYRMIWTLDNKTENAMQDASGADEAKVDLSTWTWLGQGPYHVIFRAYDSHGRVYGESSVDFKVGSTTTPTDTATTTPPPPVGSSPLAGARFYVDPSSNAAKTASSWRSTRPSDAAYMDILAARPQADWFGDWSGNVQSAVAARTTTIVGAGALPVFVAYDIPLRDCNSYSAGGATSASAYQSWIRAFAAGLAGRRAVVILEPDALSQLDCLTADKQAERIALLKDAVGVLAGASALVYLDAGNAHWTSATTIAQRLQSAGIAGAAGFSLNVSNYIANDETVAYGGAVRALVGKGYVIDTSRNALGSDGNWCNALGRGLGLPATGSTGIAGVDAFLYVKRPGESDGPCNGGPSAGGWWADYALGLAQRAASAST
jgi:endoglucanase